ncbi:hypothetical protein OSB04_012713 [Centaurea solstitialis]|uniref:Uncharacterized protein n=1 Tax=Centaurea solstitialis TaxID=347529 RepID=A0AA38TDL4_9ASTR|nr:hypothetical protein OSB04_012713 [Centaurea solstitialis]
MLNPLWFMWFSGSAKHFLRKYHNIREVIEKGEIRLLKVHTNDNLADPFTKPMTCTKHIEHARNIGLRPAKNQDQDQETNESVLQSSDPVQLK